MALPELVRRGAERDIGRFCEKESPPNLRDELRVEYHVRGNAITICETRPAWPELDPNGEWTHGKNAQIRWADGVWTLYWSDRNGRWHLYDLVEPTANLAELLAELDRDPSGIFWS